MGEGLVRPGQRTSPPEAVPQIARVLDRWVVSVHSRVGDGAQEIGARARDAGSYELDQERQREACDGLASFPSPSRAFTFASALALFFSPLARTANASAKPVVCPSEIGPHAMAATRLTSAVGAATTLLGAAFFAAGFFAGFFAAGFFADDFFDKVILGGGGVNERD